MVLKFQVGIKAILLILRLLGMYQRSLESNINQIMIKYSIITISNNLYIMLIKNFTKDFYRKVKLTRKEWPNQKHPEGVVKSLSLTLT